MPCLIDKDLKSNIKHKQIVNLMLDIYHSGFDSKSSHILHINNLQISALSNDLHFNKNMKQECKIINKFNLNVNILNILNPQDNKWHESIDIVLKSKL